MKVEVKRWIGHNVIKLGRYSVGKSIRFGMYDPKIPEALKAEVRECERKREK